MPFPPAGASSGLCVSLNTMPAKMRLLATTATALALFSTARVFRPMSVSPSLPLLNCNWLPAFPLLTLSNDPTWILRAAKPLQRRGFFVMIPPWGQAFGQRHLAPETGETPSDETRERIEMCRSIKRLRNADQPASDDEIAAAALQFVRKVSGYRAPSRANQAAFDQAVQEIAATTRALLENLGTARHVGGSTGGAYQDLK